MVRSDQGWAKSCNKVRTTSQCYVGRQTKVLIPTDAARGSPFQTPLAACGPRARHSCTCGPTYRKDALSDMSDLACMRSPPATSNRRQVLRALVRQRSASLIWVSLVAMTSIDGLNIAEFTKRSASHSISEGDRLVFTSIQLLSCSFE